MERQHHLLISCFFPSQASNKAEAWISPLPVVEVVLVYKRNKNLGLAVMQFHFDKLYPVLERMLFGQQGIDNQRGFWL